MVFLISAFVLAAATVCSARSIVYVQIKSAGTVAHAIYINMSDPQVRISVAIAKHGRGSSESFKSLVRRTRPTAAITGTFFDTKTLIPTGDISLFGTPIHQGCIGAALCIDGENRASIVPIRNGRKTHWDGFETVLCAGPRLLSQGKVCVALKQEGFRSSLHHPARRTAVGITHSGKIVFVAINRPVSLYTLAKAMAGMHVKDALCLDGGSSTGVYYAGRYIASPSRKLTNLLVAYSNGERYLAAKYQLVPLRLFIKSANHRRLRQLSLTPTIRNPFRPRLDAPRSITSLCC
jgi:exopolysaccharide biosynthesis protein